MRGRKLCWVWMIVASGACTEETLKQLQAPLEGIATVSVDGDKIKALCTGGEDSVDVAKSDIGLNILGMGDVEAMTKVAKDISTHCDTKGKERRREQSQVTSIAEFVDEHKLKIDSEDIEERRAVVCKELALTLSSDPDKRTAAIALNKNTYGCTDPGDPEEQPQRLWRISDDAASKSASASLETEGADLFFSCKKRELRAYVNAKEALGRGKVTGRVDSKKATYKVKLSRDKKFLFLPAPTARAKELARAKTLTLSYKNAKKKTRTRKFDVEGFDTALEVLQRYCKI